MLNHSESNQQPKVLDQDASGSETQTPRLWISQLSLALSGSIQRKHFIPAPHQWVSITDPDSRLRSLSAWFRGNRQHKLLLFPDAKVLVYGKTSGHCKSSGVAECRPKCPQLPDRVSVDQSRGPALNWARPLTARLWVEDQASGIKPRFQMI